MRKSVEHLGPEHVTVDIQITDSVIMRVCPEFEVRRFLFMKDILKAHGCVYLSNKYPDQYPKWGLRGRCYDQAFRLARQHPELTYCEGVMVARLPHGGVLPMPHGWCVNDGGDIIDPTAHNLQHLPSLSYWGIQIRMGYLIKWYQKYGYHGLLDGHPELGDSVGVYVDDPKEWKV